MYKRERERERRANERREEKEIVSFQHEQRTKENLDFIHTKTIFFPYVQRETEEECRYSK